MFRGVPLQHSARFLFKPLYPLLGVCFPVLVRVHGAFKSAGGSGGDGSVALADNVRGARAAKNKVAATTGGGQAGTRVVQPFLLQRNFRFQGASCPVFP